MNRTRKTIITIDENTGTETDIIIIVPVYDLGKYTQFVFCIYYTITIIRTRVFV